MKGTVKKVMALFMAAGIISSFGITAAADTLEKKDGIMYITKDSGETAPYTGWSKKGDKRCFYKNGVMKKNCWLSIKGRKKYYLTKDGSAAVGKITVSGIEYEFDENGALIPDSWGITLTAKDVTPTGMTLVILWDGTETEGELEYGEEYHLEQYKGGKWQRVSYKKDDESFFDIAYTVEANVPVEKNINWEYSYGELGAGKYRYCTNFNDYVKTADYNPKTYYAYFDISE